MCLEMQRQAEGEAGSTQEARHGTPSWVSMVMPWAEGGAKLLSHLGCPPGILYEMYYMKTLKGFHV